MADEEKYDQDENHEEEPDDEAVPLEDREILEALPGIGEF